MFVAARYSQAEQWTVQWAQQQSQRQQQCVAYSKEIDAIYDIFPLQFTLHPLWVRCARVLSNTFICCIASLQPVHSFFHT